MKNKKLFLKITTWTIAAQAVIWMCLAGIWLMTIAADNAFFYLFAVLMIMNAIIMLTTAWLINKQNYWIHNITIAYFVILLILTLTDQFGVYDLIILIFNIFIIALLIFLRPFIGKKPKITAPESIS